MTRSHRPPDDTNIRDSTGRLISLSEHPPLVPFANPNVAGIDVTVDPVGQASCADGASGLGGFVRVVATNGVGAVTSSKTFSFDYQ